MKNKWNLNEMKEAIPLLCEEGKSNLKNYCCFDKVVSPPSRYPKADLPLTDRRCCKYNDVGEEFHVSISKKPTENLGILILSGKNFRPAWPAVLDIEKGSVASNCSNLRIGDQIKELCGVPTESLTHHQVLALFNKATDQIYMTLRRGVEASDRSFDWFKYPFCTVSQKFDEVVVYENRQDGTVKNNARFTSFKVDDNCVEKQKKTSFHKEFDYVNKKANYKTSRAMTLPFRKKIPFHLEKTKYYSSEDNLIDYKLSLMSLPQCEGKYIVNEIEKIEKRENDSLTSAFSTSTISSFSSSSTNQDSSTNQRNWMDNVIQTSPVIRTAPELNGSNVMTHNTHFETGTEIIKNICRSPVNTIRNSFRRRKDKRDQQNGEVENDEKSILHGGSNGNAFLVTVWIGDRKKLGLKIGGGSVSPYGDSTLNVLEIKRHGTAAKVFEIGDEILEIDSKVTTGMNVYEANSVISKLEGNYVEFKIFRPSNK